jgi:ATP-binding cassette, subfamily B, bacterial
MRRLMRSPFGQLLIAHLRQSKGRLFFGAFCLVAYSLADLLTPWPLKLIFDHVLLDKPVPHILTPLWNLLHNQKVALTIALSFGILLTAACKGTFAYLQLYQTARVGLQFVSVLRRELFAHLQSLSLSFHSRAKSGETLINVTSDTNTLKDVLGGNLFDLAGQILTLVGMFAILFWLNAKLSLAVLVTFPILIWSIFTVYRRTRLSARAQRHREGQLASRISEALGSVLLVRAFAREGYEQRQFNEESTRTLEESVRTARMEGAGARAIEIINSLGVWACVLFGTLLALRREMTPGDVLIFTSYLTSMYKPLRNMAKLSSALSKASVAAERISAILEVDAEPDTGSYVPSNGLKGEIAFRHVNFAYSDDAPVLRDVSFTVHQGQRVALVGASGAGKSTIASLILRFYTPSSGQVLIDGIDVTNYQRDGLRREIGVVLQDSLLFGVSIRENITYGKPEATDEEVITAARQAHAHDFISALSDGYDTVIGERGCTLSGGQRQRLCLARAIIKRPSLLILDEPTASIDAESAWLIQQAIERLQSGKTTLVIAHHFNEMDSFDQILVLREGAIAEQGTHGELLRREGYYAQLYRLQLRKELDETSPVTSGAASRK